MFNKKRPGDETDRTSSTSSTKSASPTDTGASRIRPLATSSAPPAQTAYPTKSPFPLTKNQTGTATDTSAEKETPTGSRLHVGKDIHLKGEITACDRLIVEGKVEASMNSSEIEISESGIFIGEVNIDTADISGRFEGTLTAHNRLIVRKTGRVSGKIHYGEIEIEPGGEISGELMKAAFNNKEGKGKKPASSAKMADARVASSTG